MTEQTKKVDWGIIIIMMLGTFVAVFNETLLNVALPSIMKDFNIQATTGQWLSTAFMLTSGIFIPMTAFLIEKYSVRKLFLYAMTMFSIGTILAGFSTSFEILLLARVVQALGTAMLIPLLMSYFLTAFPPEKRGSAMGILGISLVMAPALGPTISGYIVEHYDWRMLFHIVTPVALFVLVFAFIKLKDDKKTGSGKLHFASLILSSIGFGGLLYGLSSAGDSSNGWGWTLKDGSFNGKVYISLIAGIISLVIYIYTQLKTDKPMLDFYVYKSPAYALSSVILIILMMINFSAMLVLPLFSQTVLKLSPVDSGLALLPGALINGLAMPITGRMFDKFGSKVLVLPGLAILMVTTFLFSRLTINTTFTHLTLLYAAQMFGLSMIMMPNMTNGLNSISSDLYPHGTAMNSTLQQIGGAFGSALLISVMSNSTDSYILDHTGKTLAALKTLPPQEMIKYAKISMDASVHGMNAAFKVSFGLAIFAFICSFFIKRAVPPDGEKRQSEMH